MVCMNDKTALTNGFEALERVRRVMRRQNLDYQTVSSPGHTVRVTTWTSDAGLHYQFRVDGVLTGWGVIGPETDEDEW